MNYMNHPSLTREKLDPAIIKAVREAFKRPCAVCGERCQVVRHLVPQRPQMFCLPDSVAIYLPLCNECQRIEATELEAHLLACRIIQAAEVMGIPLGLED